jgi:hypothetical protein
MQPSPSTQVGVYIDGFNLYYGGRVLRGPRPLRQGHSRLAMVGPARPRDTRRQQPVHMVSAKIHRVVYCTAVISGADNPVGNREQDVYVRALKRVQVIDRIELGLRASSRDSSAGNSRPERPASHQKSGVAGDGQRRRGL